ncbi:MAG TPA: HIT domain-containing protein [Chloroflexota bacterium]
MDQLWATWRMEYIAGSEPTPGCLFCSMARAQEDEKNYVVFRADRCFVVLNRYPYNSGHLMVVPYQHVGEIAGIEPATGAQLFAITQLAIRVLDETMHPDGFNAGFNQGAVAGAGIKDHIHLHVVPRWNGDTNFMPVLADAKVMPESLAATAEKVRPIFNRLGTSS